MILRTLLCLLALPFALSLAADATPSKPNIVLIISDDQAWTDFGFMGHPHIKTPALDQLARGGLTFTRGYVPSSLCCPSLASIITGRWPHQHLITSNDPPIPAGMKPRAFQGSAAFKEGREQMNQFMDAQATLPRLLVKNGYLALQTGKWWQGEYTRGGFTHGMTKGGRHGDAGLDIGRKTMQPIYDFIGEAQKEKKPFFVWYAPMMPHDPHTPPQALLDKYLAVQPNEHIARYWAMIEWFDQTIGDLTKHLKEQGLEDNTIVAFVTDNGWIQSTDKPQYAPKSKQSQYDGGLRTPIILRWPGKVPPRMDEQPIMSLDLAPTLLRAAGIEPPAAMQGVNLFDDKAVVARKTLFGDCFTHNSMKLGDPPASLRWRWVLENNLKLIVPHAANEPDAVVELYDLKADPHEEHNLASERPDIVRDYTAKLDGWWKP